MHTHTSTFGLVDRIQKGDREAFTLLFEKYRRRLAVLIHYRLGAELRGVLEVDDVLQETFLRAFRDLERFTYRAPGSFMQWLAAVAAHVLADLARYHARRQRDAAQVVPLSADSRPDAPELVDSRTPSRVLAEHEGVLRLMRKLDALPEQYREVIVLAKIEGLTTAELAERLGKPREAVSLLLHRALERLRTLAEKPA